MEKQKLSLWSGLITIWTTGIFHHHVRTGSETKTSSYPTDTANYFNGDKAAEARIKAAESSAEIHSTRFIFIAPWYLLGITFPLPETERMENLKLYTGC